jgi:hypothetical protein
VVPDTALGLLLLVVAVLPGLTYTLAFERQAGVAKAPPADRTLRFVVLSALFHAVAAWPEYGVWRVTLGSGDPVRAGDFGLLWLAAILLIAIPAAAGTLVGRLHDDAESRPDWQRGLLFWTMGVTGPDVVSRAWDGFFAAEPSTYLRVRTVDGTMLAGLFASASFASGYPQPPELLLEEAWALDPATGELSHPLGYPLYVAPGQIAWMEIVPPQWGGIDHGPSEAGAADPGPPGHQHG